MEWGIRRRVGSPPCPSTPRGPDHAAVHRLGLPARRFLFLPDGSLLASDVEGEYDLDDADGSLAYSGRFTIPAAKLGPLA